MMVYPLLITLLFVFTQKVAWAFSTHRCITVSSDLKVFDRAHRAPMQRCPSRLFSASLPSEQNTEETLMKISFSISSDIEQSEAIDLLKSYIASFPFSAVLPVQPLTYIPREDGKGVDVSFLRKKTQEKGSIDGGVEFLISSSNGSDDDGTIELTALRNAEGQSISKIFSEGLIIKSFTSGLYGFGGYIGKNRDELLENLKMESVFHKWM